MHLSTGIVRANRFLGRLLIPVFMAGLLLSAPPPASGQVLQGPHVLDLMVRALAGARTLRVHQQVTVIDATISDDPLVLNETVNYIFPERFRSDAWHPDIHRIHASAHGDSVTIIDGRRVTDSSLRWDRYHELLIHRSRQQLHRTLLLLGVDVEKTSLGRHEDLIVFVLGAQYPDKTVSQVWVDRERFLPVRWLLVSDSNPDDVVDISYGNWRTEGRQWYPARIDTYAENRLIRSVEVQEIQADIDISMALFDLSQLIARYPLAEPDEAPDLLPPDEVQEAIEDALQVESVE